MVVLDPRPSRSYAIESALFDSHGIGFLVPDSNRATPVELGGADVLLVHLGPIRPADVAAMTRARGVVIYAIGRDAADSPEVKESGLLVRSVPGYCIDEVSDHAIALLLASERQIVGLDIATREGKWLQAKSSLRLRRLRGRSLGIVGAGRIGKEVARKARAFGLQTLAFDPYLAPDSIDGLTMVPFEELLVLSDIVILTVPLTAETRHLMDERAFSRMRQGSLLVNVSRGGVVDEVALVAALDQGRPAFAALDVREDEPPILKDPLFKRRDVIFTPHIAASSVEAGASLSTQVAELAIEMIEGGTTSARSV